MADAAPQEQEIKIDTAALASADEGTISAALVGLFSDGDEEIEQEGQGSPANAGPEETPATSDTEEGQSEPSEETPDAIEPPASWTAEAKQNFAKLPPELQTYVAERERDREALIATQGRKTSEEAQRLQALQQQMSNERAQQVGLINSVLLQLTPELQKFNGVDWDKLSRENPAEWAAKSQEYQSLVTRMNAAQQAVTHLNNQQQAESARKLEDFKKEQLALLSQKIPDFADEAKGKARAADLAKYIPELTPEDWGQILDHRFIVLANEIMEGRKERAARAAAATKRVPNQPGAKVLKAAARPPQQGQEGVDQNRIGALHERLAKSGDFKDAGDILAAAGLFN